MIKYVRQIRPASGKQKSAALANKKQEKFDQICADNLIKRSGTRIDRKECTVKNFVFWSRSIWKFRKLPRTLIRSRSLYACTNPSHDSVPLSNVTFKHLKKALLWRKNKKNQCTPSEERCNVVMFFYYLRFKAEQCIWKDWCVRLVFCLAFCPPPLCRVHGRPRLLLHLNKEKIV